MFSYSALPILQCLIFTVADSSIRSDVNDAKYQDLVASYTTLETENKELRNKYDHLQSVCHDLSTETRILGKMLVSLKQLVN